MWGREVWLGDPGLLAVKLGSFPSPSSCHGVIPLPSQFHPAVVIHEAVLCPSTWVAPCGSSLPLLLSHLRPCISAAPLRILQLT